MKWGAVKESDDSQNIRQITVKTRGDETANATSAEPYGLAACPPTNAPALVLTLDDGSEVILAVGDSRYTLRGLARGDVALYNAAGVTLVLRGGTQPMIEVNAPIVRIGPEPPGGWTAGDGVLTGKTLDPYTALRFEEIPGVGVSTKVFAAGGAIP